MTQDEYIQELALQAGLFEITREGYEIFYPENLEAFAALVVAAEREACAKVCDEAKAARLAEVIRARGETK